LSIFNEKNGEKTLPRSIYIKILVFVGIIGISIIVMRPVQSAISRVMIHIRTNFLEKIEEHIGMEIRYSSIRPTFFGSIDIRYLRLIKDGNVFLNVNRAGIYFSVPDLLFRKKFAVHTIRIDRPVLRVDYERDKDTFELLSSLLKDDEGGNRKFFRQIAEFLPEDADYRIQNSSLYFSGEDTALSVQDIDVDIRWNGEKIILNGKFGGEVKHSGFLDRVFLARTAVDINGAYSPGLRKGEADISFSSLSFLEQEVKKREASFLWPASNGGNGTRNFITLRPSSVKVSFNEKTLSLSTPSDATLYYDFNCDFETGGINARMDFDSFVLNDHSSFSDYWKKFNHLFGITISGSASFKHEKNGAMEYAVDILGGDFLTADGPETAAITDSFVIRAYGSEEYIVVSDFRLSASSNTAGAGLFQGIVNFQGRLGFGPFLPSGKISVERLSLNGREDVNASFNVSSNAREIRISGDSVTAGRVSLLNFNVYLYPQDRYIGIMAAADSGNEGTVYLDAVLNKKPLHLEATLSLNSFSLIDLTEVVRPFAYLFNIPSSSLDYVHNISIDTEIFFTTDFNNIVYNAPNTVLRVSNNEGFLSLSGTDHQITLSEGLFNIDENEFLVSAQFNFSNTAELVFSLDASYLDMSWHVSGQLLDRTTLIIRDPNGLHVYGFISNTGSMSGYIECMDFPVPVDEHPAYLNLYVTLRYDSIDFWYLDVAHLEIRDLQSLNGDDYFRISGVADQDGASFREILYSDAIGLLAGSADFSWNTDFSYLQFLLSMTDGHDNGEYYLIEGVAQNRRIDISASVSEMHFERFLSGNGTVLVSADAFISWDSINSFDVQIDLSSLYARMQDNVITASGGASFTNDELLMRNLRFDYRGVKSTIPLLRLNRVDGIVKTNASIHGYTDRWLEGKVDFSADFARIDSWLDIEQAFNSFNGTLHLENIQYGNAWQDEFVFVFSKNNGTVFVSGGEKNMLRFEMDNDGNFFTGLSAPIPIQGTIVGVYKKGAIDAQSSFFIDLPGLWTLTSRVSEFNVAGGYITGKLDIRGPLFNPEFFGTGRGSSLRLQVQSYITEDIRPAPFSIVAEGYEITFGPVAAITGNGGGNITGWFRFENWIPKNIGLDINVPRQTPIPYNISITNFLASGNAAGKLDLMMDIDNHFMEISGDLYTNDTEMGLNMDEIMARSEREPFSDVKFHSIVNISVTAGSMVEFVWPNTNSPMLRANPEMGTVFRVSADTQAGQYSLNSDIKIRSGELYYFERNFYIREGSMVFRENEREFSPLLSARAEIRDRSDTGPVTISMIIENEPLFSFVPRFETTPSLTQLEIYTILGQNLNSIQGDENADVLQRFILTSTTDILAQFVASSDVFSQFVFLRQFERQIRNFFHLDMFNVRTRLVQNAVVSGVTGIGQAPVDRNSRVGNYFDNTTVFLGKYFGQDMFIQGMLTMRYDENSSLFGGITIEPDIGIELESPYFNIRWDFYPNHPENLWVNDNSFTLSWSKSF
jgi:hypothetical protein